MKLGKIFWGLFFLTAAVLVVASQVVSFVDINAWHVIITVFLAAVIINAIAHLEFFGIFVPAALVYLIYQEPLDLQEISPWILLSSAVLVSIGFSILFHNRSRRYSVARFEKRHYNRTNESIDDNNPYARVAFSSTSKYLHADCMTGGQFSASLGELEVYFDQVQLSPNGANINLDCNLGSIKLYIPRDWNVIDRVNSVLGEVTNKNRYNKPGEASPTLTLSGNLHLGNVEINYI